MGHKLTDDEIIARGDIWRGDILELRKRMADFTIDNVRFGSLEAQTKSGSERDRRLTKRYEEIATAVFVLGRLWFERVRITSQDDYGRPLEQPDLDVSFANESSIGLEIAQVGNTERMQHDANIAVIEHKIWDEIKTDVEFRKSFGPYYFTVTPSGPLGERDPITKQQARGIIKEIKAFIRASGHHSPTDEAVRDPDRGFFDKSYPMLHSRGAHFHSAPMDLGPHFGVLDGGTVDSRPEIDEVLRVLNGHRKSAIQYRTSRTWMLMYLPDTNEVFRHTLAAVVEQKPLIDPFERVYITDTCGSLISLP